MKDLNKKIISFMLASSLTASVAPTIVRANSNEVVLPPEVYSEYTTKTYYMNGVYTCFVDGTPVYVYLGNNADNRVLPKYDALYASELVNEKTYVYKKTVDNPNYIKGVSPLSEKQITVYAVSGKSSVKGWTKIDKDTLGRNDLVATTIELGEFLLKGEDLSRYYFDLRGFAYTDFDKDGNYTDLLYLGNDRINVMFNNKEEAIKYAVERYEEYYFVKKEVKDPNYGIGNNKKKTTVYALSEKSYVEGWSRVNKKDIPSNVVIGSTPLCAEAMVKLGYEVKKEDTIDIPSVLPTPEPDRPIYVYNRMIKADALNYAYNCYDLFCILTKTINGEVVYAFSYYPEVEGWTMIANDSIPSNASIFLSIEDANCYEFQINYDTSKGLRY